MNDGTISECLEMVATEVAHLLRAYDWPPARRASCSRSFVRRRVTEGQRGPGRLESLQTTTLRDVGVKEGTEYFVHPVNQGMTSLRTGSGVVGFLQVIAPISWLTTGAFWDDAEGRQ